MHINGVSTQVSFQVVDCQDDEQLILGKPWIYKNQCMLNFANLRIQFTIGANQFNLPMIDEVNTSEPLPPKFLQMPKPMQPRKAIADNKKSFPSPWQYQQWVPKANLEAQGYYKGSIQVWVPKQRTSNATPKLWPSKQCSQLKKYYSRAKHSRSRGCLTRKQWIPKTLLQAQGFYHGITHIWLPKSPLQQLPQPTKRRSSTQQP